MNTKPLVIKLSLVAALSVAAPMTMTAQADILSIGSNAQVLKKANLPKAGDSMSTVSRKHGAAQSVKNQKVKSLNVIQKSHVGIMQVFQCFLRIRTLFIVLFAAKLPQ